MDQVQSKPEEKDSPEESRSVFAGTIPAPAFPQDLDWLNVQRPLTWRDLRGKVILLDFWTYGCINCMHMIPVIKQLQAKYPDELVVIGVHSAKFENEGRTENIHQIIRRYGRDEPVINDNRFQMWRAWDARAWPTVAIVDPVGNVIGIDAGEFPFEVLDHVIGGTIDWFDRQEKIDRTPLFETAAESGNADTLLSFPGKVLVDPEDNRLFISDSSHHRIVVVDLHNSRVIDIIGAGRRGFSDGEAASAMFNTPQGLALKGDSLYVADLGNHAIREVNLEGQTVHTIAGNGTMSRRIPTPGEKVDNPTDISLRSPWDLELGEDGLLYIAMAGSHQIWAYSLLDKTMYGAVGEGAEGLENGSLISSTLAQPSGLHYRDGNLYFADSESSTIRVADISGDRVLTLAGPLEDTLFDFGDVNGVVGESRLQHPLGLTDGPKGTLFVADTYNNRIKILNVAEKKVETVFGLGGNGGFRDGGADTAQFDEPGGVDYADGILYVADTNNHAVRLIEVENNTVDTLVLSNPEVLVRPERLTLIGGNTQDGDSIRHGNVTVGPGTAQISVSIQLPSGYKLNPNVESRYTFSSDSESIEIDHGKGSGAIDSINLDVPAQLNPGTAVFHGRLSIYYCREDEQSLCFLDEVALEAAVTVTEAGEQTIHFRRVVTLPETSGIGVF